MQQKRRISQILFLCIFLTLMVLNKAQYWMALVFSSILLSAIVGRFYCGWICPINTLIKVGNFMGKFTKTQKKQIPKFAKAKSTRIILTAVFALALAYTIYTMRLGQKFPLPLLIITLGLLVTVFINEKTWHRYLCPWGILFSFMGKFSKRALTIQAKACTGCKACNNLCPAEAITIKDNNAVIDSKYCLVCYQCTDTCPVDIITYKKVG